jgi:hypothetical protein
VTAVWLTAFRPEGGKGHATLAGAQTSRCGLFVRPPGESPATVFELGPGRCGKCGFLLEKDAAQVKRAT